MWDIWQVPLIEYMPVIIFDAIAKKKKRKNNLSSGDRKTDVYSKQGQ